MTLEIDLSQPNLSVMDGHLKMGGKNPHGVAINANNRYLTLGGRPWLPVMGEFHFSRYPNQYWREELLKMRAGGITVVATYIFWIHHEEIEGTVDWSGDRDLRRFLQLCAEVGLLAYPRLGPWAHGECRNGGFPDWLLEKCGNQVRQDNPLYLSYVKQFYEQIAAQLKGLLWKDGGPVVGVQLENELINNADHIFTLKQMAQAAGIDVPLYTMTGWGPAQVPADEVIPLFGGYPDAFWSRQVSEWARECRKQYLFSPVRNDDLIGNDLLPRQDIADLTYLDRYPFATCELGGGMQVSYHRRPYIMPEDVAVPLLSKLGSGSNLPGYYMYHGGSHPLGQHSTMQESQVTHYWNDLPVISYDFQAAIREYGQLNGQYAALRLMHLFLHDFGEQLAPLPAAFPDHMPADLDDGQTLRWSARSDGRRGFVFINNYQRVEPLGQKSGVQFSLVLKDETLLLPPEPVTIISGAYMLWPFNMDLNGILLRYACAQPVCTLDVDGIPCFVFAQKGGVKAVFAFDPQEPLFLQGAPMAEGNYLRDIEPGGVVTLSNHKSAVVRLLLLSEEQAMQCWKADMWGQERIFLSAAGLLFDGESVILRARNPQDLTYAVYPAPEQTLTAQGQDDGIFTCFRLPVQDQQAAVTARKVKDAGPARVVAIGPAGVAQAPEDADFEAAEVWALDFANNSLSDVSDIFLQIDYVGDAARLYLGDHLIADDFYYGRRWEIGLKRFLPDVMSQGLQLRLLPIRKDAPIYIAPEHRPDFGTADEMLFLNNVKVQIEYEAHVGML
jgi:beta-galactosidase